MTRRDVADIAPYHLFLAQRLATVLLCAMVVVMMYHSPPRCSDEAVMLLPGGVSDSDPGISRCARHPGSF